MPLLAKRCLSCGAGLPSDGLTCEFCGVAHVVTGDGGLTCACPHCGAGNRLEARHCVQCAKSILFPCPECTSENPLGSRFCHDCRIEFKSYREALVYAAPCNVRPEAVEERVLSWLEGGWFKARDIRQKLRVIEQTLFWVPVWRFGVHARGEVQGQVSQTHYRTVTTRSYDHEAEKWVDVPDSEPYEVWQHVRKDFDEQVVETLLGHPDAERLYDVLADAPRVAAKPLGERVLGGSEHERVFQPVQEAPQVFARLRRRARDHLHATLLEKVERLDLRFLQPGLSLTFHPVWDVIYRYRRSHGTVRVRGSDGHVTGKKVTLLTQWFG